MNNQDWPIGRVVVTLGAALTVIIVLYLILDKMDSGGNEVAMVGALFPSLATILAAAFGIGKVYQQGKDAGQQEGKLSGESSGRAAAAERLQPALYLLQDIVDRLPTPQAEPVAVPRSQPLIVKEYDDNPAATRRDYPMSTVQMFKTAGGAAFPSIESEDWHTFDVETIHAKAEDVLQLRSIAGRLQGVVETLSG